MDKTDLLMAEKIEKIMTAKRGKSHRKKNFFNGGPCISRNDKIFDKKSTKFLDLYFRVYTVDINK